MKKITLIISGSIGAYKALELYKKLKKDYKVKIVLSKNGHHFLKIGNIPYYQELFLKDYYEKDNKINHISLAKDSDLIIVYPASMNFISHIASGITNSLASLIIACCTCPILIFPAMNVQMYNNFINQKNIEKLRLAQIDVVEPDFGLQACGDIGLGRLLEVDNAYKIIVNKINQKKILENKIILINYGRTRTYLDKMRYITNNSTGKMGSALVKGFKSYGANVISVVGDTDEKIIGNFEYGQTNEEILVLMQKHYEKADIVICLAALNDYHVDKIIDDKISKRDNKFWPINLVANATDVLKTLGKNKNKQILIGFAAETTLDIKKAKIKLEEKNLDAIILNDLKYAGTDKNEIILIFKNQEYKIKGSKMEVAMKIIEVIVNEIR